MTPDEIAELIARRRRQVLVHSVLYYCLNENLVSDSKWAEWAVELENLQNQHQDIAAKCPYAKDFLGFDHSTGYSLPLDDPWAIRKARQLLLWRDKLKGE